MESAKIFNYYEFLTKSELNTRKLIKVWTHLFDYFFYFEEDQVEVKELSTEKSDDSMSELSRKEEESEELIKLTNDDVISDIRFNSTQSLRSGNSPISNSTSNQQKINKRREVFKYGKFGYEGVLNKRPSVELKLSKYLNFY